MLIDTHAHLWWDTYTRDLDEVIKRADDAIVKKIIMPGTDIKSSERAIELAKKYKGRLFAGVGVHPEEAKCHDSFDELGVKLEKVIEENREFVVAIGEIGTDKYREEDRMSIAKQKEFFKLQSEMAVKNNLPIIVHTRDSLKETLEVIDNLPEQPRGQFHCFSYGEEELREILERGFYVSFCGNISWSKRLQRLMPMVPLDRLLLETDSPLMKPVNERGEKVGERNEPENVKILAELQANLLNMDIKELETITSKNASDLFGI